jgi:hypothetical protein
MKLGKNIILVKFGLNEILKYGHQKQNFSLSDLCGSNNSGCFNPLN